MITLHNDEPTLRDLLRREDLLIRVGDDVAQCDPPCVFGIHGEWGSGKTSFLHQLHWYLTGDCPQQSKGERDAAVSGKKPVRADVKKNLTTVVWFEAWRYQHDKDPIIALLQEIRTQLPLYSKWLNEGRKLANVGVRGALLSMEDLTKRIGFKASKIQEAGEQWEHQHLAVALPSHTIREHLEAALKQLLGRKGSKTRRDARLVVLIDDLDRCEPSAAFKLIEGIKIYLNLPSCVFVLGMNLRIIERAIAKHTVPDEPPEIRHEYAREYLDKLCTNVWHLPMINDPAVPLGEWLPDSPVRVTMLFIVGQYDCLAANPRKIKSFANVLQRFLTHLKYDKPLADQERNSRHAELIVLMACLYHDHYELYRMIESDLSFYDLVHKWATGIVPTDPEKKSPHELLCHLRLPTGFKRADFMALAMQKPVPSPEAYSAFPDPERGNVFRLQSLVARIGKVEVSELKPYLLRGAARE